jgi:hypothetical protein
MRLVFHGGKCCGIKTIYGFESPDSLLSAVEEKSQNNIDAAGGHVSSNIDFFTDAAPQETEKERLDRLIAFCIKRRPAGIIEVTLAESHHLYWSQIPKWGPLLRKRGFKCVNKCRNSNSGNTVHVFHKNCGGE